MSIKKILVWTLGIAFLLLLFAAISIPNLLRSRIAANESSAVGTMRSISTYAQVGNVDGKLTASPPASPAMAKAGLVRAGYTQDADKRASAFEPKVIRQADLTLEVANIRDFVTRIQRFLAETHGQVDHLELNEDAEGHLAATMVLRVPSTGLDDALEHLKKLSLRADKETVSAVDVTSEFYDNQAHLKNLRAEEEQYLEIMKRAGKIEDTLEVAQRLADVRDRIERLQASIQVMNHNIELSQVSVTLHQPVETHEPEIFGVNWRPLRNARIALHDMLADAGDWADAMVALLLKLPVLLLWTATVVVLVGSFAFLCRFIWQFAKPYLPLDTVAPTSTPLTTPPPSQPAA